MRKTRGIWIWVLAVLLCALAALTACHAAPAAHYAAPDFPYTYSRTTQGGAVFYESGDPTHHYLHDEQGRVLTYAPSGQLVYATQQNGVITPSNLSFPAPTYRADAVAMGGSEIDWDANPDWVVTQRELKNQAVAAEEQVANVVIFIEFADDPSSLSDALRVREMLDGPTNSLTDYFLTVSEGTLQVQNLFPGGADAQLFIYKDAQPRSYYNVKESASAATRGAREARLLTAAVQAAADHMQLSPAIDLDANQDGFLDALSFLVAGSDSADWGNLLWPHSWNLSDINASYNGGATAEIGGKKVGDYSFNFLADLNVGLLAHEFFHVLGAPDLYHYNYDFVSVGDWDLMGFQASTPQYPLAYMRATYLNPALESRIGEITHNGIFTLKSVTEAHGSDPIAYRIPTSRAGEYFMVEYRNPSVATAYDSILPGAGLLVYRIKTGVQQGNRNAKYQNSLYPDEVYVFRPRVVSKTTDATSVRYANSRQDSQWAALSPTNPYFSSVGKTAFSLARYDYTMLFYTNGENSRISVEALSMDDDSIAFRVVVDGNQSVPETYFNDQVSLTDVNFVNADDSVSGVAGKVTFADGLDTTYLSALSMRALAADGTLLAAADMDVNRFIAAYEGGQRTFSFYHVVNDKGLKMDSIFTLGMLLSDTEPVRMEALLTDADGRTVTVASSAIGGLAWEEVLAARAVAQASLSAAPGLLLALCADGSLVAQGDHASLLGDLSGTRGVIQVAAGDSHALLRLSDLRVTAVGSDENGEGAVTTWRNVRTVVAGHHVSLGVTFTGNVLFAGQDSFGLGAATSWRDVTTLALGRTHVVGLTHDGRLLTAGQNRDGQLDLPTRSDLAGVAAGDTFTALLYADGTVCVAGALQGAGQAAQWRDIVAIRAGGAHLVALDAQGKVYAVGENGAGQCEVGALYDSLDVAASTGYTASLRRDGVVEVVGAGVEAPARNLLYAPSEYVPVATVTAQMETRTLYVGESCRVTAAYAPANATYPRLVYDSDVPDVARVDALSGQVDALRPGTVRIRVRANDSGGASGTVLIEVRERVDADDVGFARADMVVRVGEEGRVALCASPANATHFGTLTVRAEGEGVSAGVREPTGSRLPEVWVTAEQAGTFTLTLTYFAPDGVQKTHACRVQAIEGERTVTLQERGRVRYRYGEALEDDGVLLVTDSDGTSVQVGVTASMKGGYDPNVVGTQRVTITYLGQTLEYEVEVVDWVREVRVEPNKTQYRWGEEPADGDASYVAVYASGEEAEKEALPAAAIAGFDKQSVGLKRLSVTLSFPDPITDAPYAVYGSYEVLICDYAVSLEATFGFSTLHYLQPIPHAELLMLTTASGVKRFIQVSETTISGYDPKLFGEQRVTFSYPDAGGEPLEAQVVVEVDRPKTCTLSALGADWQQEGGTPCLYFLVGEPLPSIEVLLVYPDGYQVEARQGDAGLWYDYGTLDNTQPGVAAAALYVWGMAASGPILLFGRDILAYGLSPSSTFTLDCPAVVPCTEPLEADLLIEQPGADPVQVRIAADKLRYDPTLLDQPQTLAVYVEFLGRDVETTFTLHDKAASLTLLHEATFAYFGTPPEFWVQIETVNGNTRQLQAGEFEWRFEQDKASGRGKIVVTYDGLEQTWEFDLVDVATGIAWLDTPQTYYHYGQELDLNFRVRITFLSGETKDVVVAQEKNLNVHSDFALDQPGTYTVTLTYLGSQQSLNYAVYLNHYVQALQVQFPAQLNYGEALTGTVTALWSDDTRRTLRASEWSSDFAPDRVGTQTVTVFYDYSLTYGVKTERCSARVEVYVRDVARHISVTPLKERYRYGEALSVKISVTFQVGGQQDFLSTQGFSVSYDPTRVGMQMVVVAMDSVSASFRVSVLAKTEETLRLGTQEGVTITQNTVFSQVPLTPAQVEALFLPDASYLHCALSDPDAPYFPTNGSVEVRNGAEQVIFRYRYVLAGDANLDGVVDFEDLTAMAHAYVNGIADPDVCGHDGSDTVSLTDLVQWFLEVHARNLPAESPLNRMARALIASEGTGCKRRTCKGAQILV